MEVKAISLAAWYLVQKLVCSENIEGGKFDVVCVSAESATDITEEEHYSVAV